MDPFDRDKRDREPKISGLGRGSISWMQADNANMGLRRPHILSSNQSLGWFIFIYVYITNTILLYHIFKDKFIYFCVQIPLLQGVRNKLYRSKLQEEKSRNCQQMLPNLFQR